MKTIENTYTYIHDHNDIEVCDAKFFLAKNYLKGMTDALFPIFVSENEQIKDGDIIIVKHDDGSYNFHICKEYKKFDGFNMCYVGAIGFTTDVCWKIIVPTVDINTDDVTFLKNGDNVRIVCTPNDDDSRNYNPEKNKIYHKIKDNFSIIPFEKDGWEGV